MSLKIYNTLHKKIEEFKPLQAGKVKMYVCGPTVYDYLHVGNFRGAIFFNLVRRWFEKSGYEVNYVYNYTDVDDKIIKRAAELNVSTKEISEKYIQEFEKDYAALKLTKHEANPRVTDHIDDVIHVIEKLIENEKAYVVDGEVFYSINDFEHYGCLSGKKIDELEAGTRVEVDEKKRNPLDFVLWKPSKEGEPSWQSPWGAGRPGWHIECSTMILTLLGDQIDIHGGGIDLIFPHHENEIAQSEGVTHKPSVNYWMHNNFIQFGDDKMSKSLGNVITARAFMEKYNPEILKFIILSVHYRSLLNFDQHQIYQSIQSLAKVYSSLALADTVLESADTISEPDAGFKNALDEADKAIEKALNDDFNTAVFFAKIYEIVKLWNSSYMRGRKITQAVIARAAAFRNWMERWGDLLALFQEKPQELLTKLDDILLKEKQLDRAEIDSKVEQRTQARRDKDFAESDRLRDELTALGIELQDSAEGTYWEVKKGDVTE